MLSLGASALLFSMANVPIFGVLAVFLFNMSMPMTLFAATRLLPNARGFAFGILTFALFMGALPTLLGCAPLLTAPYQFVLFTLGSLALLWFGLKRSDIT